MTTFYNNLELLRIAIRFKKLVIKVKKNKKFIKLLAFLQKENFIISFFCQGFYTYIYLKYMIQNTPLIQNLVIFSVKIRSIFLTNQALYNLKYVGKNIILSTIYGYMLYTQIVKKKLGGKLLCLIF
jgi:ribosomal protein S8